MILVDTDVVIWNLRGNEKAADLLDGRPGFSMSAVSYMELLQGLKDKNELRTLRRAVDFWSARIVQVSEAISSRACYLVERHALADSMQLADALIAATALELGLDLVTANDRHYRVVDALTVQVFRP